MTHTTTLITNQEHIENDMFADLDPLTAFDVKKDYIATQLAALMIHCGKNRSKMAEELGWKKSRITKVLSGHNNLTVKTICDFTTHLGYDFDVIFHGPNDQRPRQPWQMVKSEITSIWSEVPVEYPLPSFVLNVHPIHEIEADLKEKTNRSHYLSIDILDVATDKLNTRRLDTDTSLQVLPSIPSLRLPASQVYSNPDKSNKEFV